MSKFLLAYGPIGGATLGYYAGERQAYAPTADDEHVVVYGSEKAAKADAKAFNAQPHRVTQGHEYRVEPA